MMLMEEKEKVFEKIFNSPDTSKEVQNEYHIHLDKLDNMTNQLVNHTKEMVVRHERENTKKFMAEMEKNSENEEPEPQQVPSDITEMSSVKRIKTGIKGLDELIEGGIPEKSVVLITGSAGTGKTIFALNFLVEGALNGEPGVYISLQESPQENIIQMKLFGWPIEDLIKENKILMIQPELYNFEGLLSVIEDSVEKTKAKRLVIDSASIIGLYFENPYKVRKSLLDLGQLFKRLGCTTLAIDEIKENENTLSAFGVEEFVSDGVIVLYYLRRNNIYIRAITIRKLRSTNHSQKVHPLEIRRPGGVMIYPFEEVFTEID